jgi:two-component system chemotaxis response regulator CheB
LAKIKHYGGIAIVQDPKEAMYSQMPLNAIRKSDCDYILTLSEISRQLINLVEVQAERQALAMNEEEFDEASNLETSPQSKHFQHGEDVYHRGKPSIFSCPDCGGVLAEINEDRIIRFVCRVGHSYSTEWLLAMQSEGVEKALWSALRALEEGASFAQEMAEKSSEARQQYLEKAEDYERQANVLRPLLLKKG